MATLDVTIPSAAAPTIHVGPRKRSQGQRSAFGTAWPRRFEGRSVELLGELRTEYDRLMDTLASTRRTLVELRSTRQAAERADLRAAADALRRGEPSPAPSAVLAHGEAVRAAERQSEAAILALRDVRADVDVIVREHRPELVTDTTPHVATAQARVDGLLGELQDAMGELVDWRATLAWATDYPGTRAAPRLPSVATKRLGDSLSATALLGLLRDAVAPAQPSRVLTFAAEGDED